MIILIKCIKAIYIEHIQYNMYKLQKKHIYFYYILLIASLFIFGICIRFPVLMLHLCA